MVKLDRITTGAGDAGMTSLADGCRVAKDHPRVAAYGSVDELNSLLGVVRAEGLPAWMDRELERLQHELFDLGADLATPVASAETAPPPRIGEEHILRLERAVSAAAKQLMPASSFILPGGSRPSAALHLARAVARRSERDVLTLVRFEAERGSAVSLRCLTYLNRLSDLCFVWARLCNDHGRADILWRPDSER